MPLGPGKSPALQHLIAIRAASDPYAGRKNQRLQRDHIGAAANIAIQHQDTQKKPAFSSAGDNLGVNIIISKDILHSVRTCLGGNEGDARAAVAHGRVVVHVQPGRSGPLFPADAVCAMYDVSKRSQLDMKLIGTF